MGERREILGLFAALSLSLGTKALAQTPLAPLPAVSGSPSRSALRPPNIPNARGTDSSAGSACDQLTAYGQVQPPGPAAMGYGAASPTPGPNIAMPTYSAPAAQRADSMLGAGGMATRGTFMPDAPVLPYHNVPAPQPPRGSPAFATLYDDDAGRQDDVRQRYAEQRSRSSS